MNQMNFTGEHKTFETAAEKVAGDEEIEMQGES
jgi:hypothetical protein